MISGAFCRTNLSSLSKLSYQRNDDDEEEAARERRRRARQERLRQKEDDGLGQGIEKPEMNAQNNIAEGESKSTTVTTVTTTQGDGDDDAVFLERMARREERRQKRLQEALERQKELDPTVTDETVSFTSRKVVNNVEENETPGREEKVETHRRHYEVEETETITKSYQRNNLEQDEEDEKKDEEDKEDVEDQKPKPQALEENQVELTVEKENVDNEEESAVLEGKHLEVNAEEDKLDNNTHVLASSKEGLSITVVIDENKEENNEAEMNQKQIEERERLEREERERAEAEEQRKAEEEKERLEAEKREAEEKAKREAEEKAKREAEEKARLEAEERERVKAEEQQKAEEERKRMEKEEAEKKKAAQEKERREAEERERRKAAEEKKAAEERERAKKEKREAEEKAKAEAKRAAEEKAKLEEERLKAKQKAEEKRVDQLKGKKGDEKKIEEKQVKEKKLQEEKITAASLRKQGEENKVEAKKENLQDKKLQPAFRKEEMKDNKLNRDKMPKEEAKSIWDRKKGIPDSKPQNGECIQELPAHKLKHTEHAFGRPGFKTTPGTEDGKPQVEAGKRVEELRRRRGENESEEFEKLKQKQQVAAVELEELKKKREERKKILEDEEQRRKKEEAERKVREEEEKRRLKEEIERRRAEAAEKRQKMPEEAQGDDKKPFKCFTPKGSALKIEERAEFLNKSVQKSGMKPTHTTPVVSKIDSRLEQYTSAIEGNKAAKATKPAASDLPVPAEGVRNIKSMWEKGNVFASPSGMGTPNKETAGLKVGVSSRINEWLTKTPESNKLAASKPSDLRPGDVSGKRNLWEKQSVEKTSSSSKVTAAGRKLETNAGLRQFEKEP
ncbi:caldesmon isoform X3 [Notechis scutatus]|uniref:Caldesmon isoform X3 n=1 Tax=Notechis scutatus TaxID=8663 RepID=A0A6J1V3N6_9SAUR|nr:caldesmon isoform X3 [Notechis scutatus]